MIAVWLLADELAAATAAHNFVDDPERREELARAVLAHLNYRPDGETVAQATDRLLCISGSMMNFRTADTTGHPLLIASHPVVAGRYLAFHMRALRRFAIALEHGRG